PPLTSRHACQPAYALAAIDKPSATSAHRRAVLVRRSDATSATVRATATTAPTVTAAGTLLASVRVPSATPPQVIAAAASVAPAERAVDAPARATGSGAEVSDVSGDVRWGIAAPRRRVDRCFWRSTLTPGVHGTVRSWCGSASTRRVWAVRAHRGFTVQPEPPRPVGCAHHPDAGPTADRRRRRWRRVQDDLACGVEHVRAVRSAVQT